jgi:hypothetical protein
LKELASVPANKILKGTSELKRDKITWKMGKNYVNTYNFYSSPAIARIIGKAMACARHTMNEEKECNLIVKPNRNLHFRKLRSAHLHVFFTL